MPDEAFTDRTSRYRFGIAAAFALLAWVSAWIVAFPNAYGWRFDDVMEFGIFVASPVNELVRPQYLYAWTWFIATIPLALHTLFHVSIPSLPMGDDNWNAAITGYFRLFMLWTLLLQLAILTMLAVFLASVLRNFAAAFTALAAFLLTPPLNFWADNIDNRLLGMLVALPAMWLIYKLTIASRTQTPAVRVAFAAGLLLAVGQSIHYTCLYIAVPWVICAAIVLIRRLPPMMTARLAGGFFAGVGIFFAVCELVYRLVPGPAEDDPVLFLFKQDAAHIAKFGFALKASLWLESFVTLMGVPMMLLVAAGVAICLVPRLRPAWLSYEAATLPAGSAVVAGAYFLLTPSLGFYRQTACLQICYCALAAIAVVAITAKLAPAIRYPAQILLAALILWIPATQSLANYNGNQGVGRALRYAHAHESGGSTSFVDWTVVKPVHAALAGIRANDQLVTMMPYHLLKDPATLGILHVVRPAAAFYAQQCTREAYLEGAGLNKFRHWDQEPEACEARVYSGRDILREIDVPAIEVAHVTSDSNWQPAYSAENVMPGAGVPKSVEAGWISASIPGPHWVELQFARAAEIGALTVVPPEYIGSGDRFENLQIVGSDSASGALHPLWSGDNLERAAVLTVTWPPQRLLRIRLITGHTPNRLAWLNRFNYPVDSVGIRAILVPHHRLVFADQRTRAGSTR